MKTNEQDSTGRSIRAVVYTMVKPANPQGGGGPAPLGELLGLKTLGDSGVLYPRKPGEEASAFKDRILDLIACAQPGVIPMLVEVRESA